MKASINKRMLAFPKEGQPGMTKYEFVVLEIFKQFADSTTQDHMYQSHMQRSIQLANLFFDRIENVVENTK